MQILTNPIFHNNNHHHHLNNLKKETKLLEIGLIKVEISKNKINNQIKFNNKIKKLKINKKKRWMRQIKNFIMIIYKIGLTKINNENKNRVDKSQKNGIFLMICNKMILMNLKIKDKGSRIMMNKTKINMIITIAMLIKLNKNCNKKRTILKEHIIMIIKIKEINHNIIKITSIMRYKN